MGKHGFESDGGISSIALFIASGIVLALSLALNAWLIATVFFLL
jgi:hypothetical protein